MDDWNYREVWVCCNLLGAYRNFETMHNRVVIVANSSNVEAIVRASASLRSRTNLKTTLDFDAVAYYLDENGNEETFQ